MMTIEKLHKWIEQNVWTRGEVAGWVEARFFRKVVHRSTSSGSQHAGLPVVLDDSGVLDASLTQTSGTWTPEVADAATGGNVATATTALGRYTRVGNRVDIDCLLEAIDTTGLTAGNVLFIRNFPFTSSATATLQSKGACEVSKVAFGGYVTVKMLVSSTNAALVDNTTGADVSNIIVSDLTSGQADIAFSLTCFVD